MTVVAMGHGDHDEREVRLSGWEGLLIGAAALLQRRSPAEVRHEVEAEATEAVRAYAATDPPEDTVPDYFRGWLERDGTGGGS